MIGRGGAPIARQISVVVVNIVAVQYTAFEVLTLCDCCEFAEQKNRHTQANQARSHPESKVATSHAV